MTVALILLALLALIPGWLAARKRVTHRAEVFVTYYLFGLMLLIAAIPAAIWVAKDERDEGDAADRITEHLSHGA